MKEEEKSKEHKNEYRKIIHYKHYFDDFYNERSKKEKEKITYIMGNIRTQKHISSDFFKQIKGYKGLYEIRIQWQRNIYRVFCCFDEDKLVILFNGFAKKTQKTPINEIEQAISLMNEYFNTKEINENKNNKQRK